MHDWSAPSLARFLPTVRGDLLVELVPLLLQVVVVDLAGLTVARRVGRGIPPPAATIDRRSAARIDGGATGAPFGLASGLPGLPLLSLLSSALGDSLVAGFRVPPGVMSVLGSTRVTGDGTRDPVLFKRCSSVRRRVRVRPGSPILGVGNHELYQVNAIRYRPGALACAGRPSGSIQPDVPRQRQSSTCPDCGTYRCDRSRPGGDAPTGRGWLDLCLLAEIASSPRLVVSANLPKRYSLLVLQSRPEANRLTSALTVAVISSAIMPGVNESSRDWR